MSSIPKVNNTINTEKHSSNDDLLERMLKNIKKAGKYDYTPTTKETLPEQIRDYNESFQVVEGTGEILEDVSGSGRLVNWHEYKNNSMKLYFAVLNWNKILASTEYDSIMSDKQLIRLYFCGNDLTFAVNQEGNKQLKHAYFCKHKLCPMCNFRRSLKMYKQVSRVVEAIKKDDETVQYLFLTLTVKNCKLEDLKKTVDSINKAYCKMLTHKRTKHNAKLHDSVLGSIKCVEVTFNTKDNTVHPHIHAIVAVKGSYFTSCSRYCSHEYFQNLWKYYLKLDYMPQVNIQKIDTTERCNAVAEASKYPIKLDMDKLIEGYNNINTAIRISEYVRQMHKKRMVTFYGIFKDYKQKLSLDDIENGDLIGTSDDTIDAIEYQIYRYNARVGFYIC